MSEIITSEDRFIIDTMLWSFSRLNSFYTCPYEFYLHYVLCNKGSNNFFGQFGSFIHKILEMYAKDQLSIFEISQYYEENFYYEVTENAPPNKYVDIKQSYFDKGLDYLDNLNLILDNYEVLGVEKEVKFQIAGYEMIGYIDLLLKEKESDKIIILDHKSASLKFKKNGEISKTDMQHFLEFKRQLYLYSIPVIEECRHVEFLEWNLFKDQKNIKIPWNVDDYNEAINWAHNTIKLIENETAWLPKTDYYYCNYLCGQRRNACEYKT